MRVRKGGSEGRKSKETFRLKKERSCGGAEERNETRTECVKICEKRGKGEKEGRKRGKEEQRKRRKLENNR